MRHDIRPRGMIAQGLAIRVLGYWLSGICLLLGGLLGPAWSQTLPSNALDTRSGLVARVEPPPPSSFKVSAPAAAVPDTRATSAPPTSIPAPGVAVLGGSADSTGQPDAADEAPQEIKDALPDLQNIDLVTPPDDLWERVRNGFAMPNLNSPLVAERENWYASRPTLLKLMVGRSRRYLYHIVDELEKRGMPTELALLPMVESAFNPMASSPANASGLWQFIPSTGKNYNLEQNWWYDARRDIIASTNAALDYLQYLYDLYGDWDLALASYNWGENAVARAVEKNKSKGLPTDYLSLNMPTETRYYVPKLQALKNIISHPEAYNLDLGPIPNQPYFVTVRKTRDMDISVAAKLAEMPVQELIALNPAYNRPVVSASEGDVLVLPADRAEIFRTNLANHDEPFLSWQAYTLKHGDKLDHIAAQHGITLARLKQLNGLNGRVRIHPGIQLLLPIKGRGAETVPVMLQPPPTPPMAMVMHSRPAATRAEPAAPTLVHHTVQRGDTLLSIAQHYNVSADDLRRWNTIGRLMAGQKLAIHLPGANNAPDAADEKSAVTRPQARANVRVAHATTGRPRNAKIHQAKPVTRVAAAKTATRTTRVAKNTHTHARLVQQAKR